MGYSLTGNSSDEGVRKLYEAVVKDGRSLVGMLDQNNTDNESVIKKFPSGNIFVIKNENNGVTTHSLKYSYKDKLDFFRANDILKEKSIIESCLADNCVTSNKIKDYSITMDKIDNETINQNKIVEGAVLSKHIATGNILTRHYGSNSINSAALGSSCVTSTKLANASVIGSKIASLAVDTQHLSNTSVTTAKINDGAVTTAKINNYAVTADKISSFSIKNIHITSDSIDKRAILDGAVVSAKLADSSVIASKIAANAVTVSAIKDGNVTSAKLSIDVRDILNRAVLYQDGAILTDGLVSAGRVFSKILGITGYASITGSLYAGSFSTNGSITANGTITGSRVINPCYGDLAEAYVPGEPCSPGDIMEIRSDNKIYKAKNSGSCIVGVVSDRYAICFKGSEKELQDKTKTPIGLIGQVPVKVMGKVRIGQYITVKGDGIGVASYSSVSGVIGKAIENKTTEGIDKVLCIVFPH